MEVLILFPWNVFLADHSKLNDKKVRKKSDCNNNKFVSEYKKYLK